MPPLVVYISNTSSTPTLSGRFFAFQARWTSVSGNIAQTATATSDMSTELGIDDLSFDDLGGVPYFNIDFLTAGDAEAFENDIAYLTVGLSDVNETNKNVDDIVDLIYFDVTQGSRTGSRITWSNTDTGTTDLIGSLVNGDFSYIVCHTSGNAVDDTGVISTTVTSSTPTVGDVITFSRTHLGASVPDWDKWVVSGTSTEGTDWQWVNSTDEYSASPQMEILTANHTITVDYQARWDGTGTGASPWTTSSSNNTLTISPVAGASSYVQKLVGSWSGLFQFVATTTSGSKTVIELSAGAERWGQGNIRLWNGSEAGNFGASQNRNRHNFSTGSDCDKFWKGTDPTNFGDGFKVRVSFDNEASWIWLNASGTDAVVSGACQPGYINTSGQSTNIINAISTVSGGANNDFYSGLPMVVEVYDL